jgi:hypothetical protein
MAWLIDYWSIHKSKEFLDWMKFEWALQNDISKLKYVSWICWNENDTHF